VDWSRVDVSYFLACIRDLRAKRKMDNTTETEVLKMDG
jgi:hypothetical protein